MRRLTANPASASSPLLWFAVLGAPLGWALQIGAGYWLSEAKCSPGGGELLGVGLGVWMVPLTAIAAVAAIGAGLTALGLYRRTEENDDDDPAPPGRIHFLSQVGIAVAPLFLALIALTALGAYSHLGCVQS